MNRRIKITQYLGFFTIGLISSLTGPVIPSIRAEIPMSYGQIGFLLSGMCPGIILMILIGGRLIDRYGTKPLLMAGGAALCLGLFGGTVSTGYFGLLSSAMISGVGFGAYVIGINVLCSINNETRKGRAFNFLHFFFGLGAVAGPLLGTACIGLGWSWRLAYGIAALMPLTVLVFLKPLGFGKMITYEPSGNCLPLKSRLLWIAGLFILIYSGTEAALQGWIVSYWTRVMPQGAVPASSTASLFWIALTLGRLFSGRTADRTGFAPFLTWTTVVGLGLALVWVFVPTATATFIVVFFLGLVLAGIFPTETALLTSRFPGMNSLIIPFINGSGASGSFIIPSVAGKIADWAGIIRLPALMLVLLSIMFSLALYQAKLFKRPEVPLFPESI